MTTCWKSSFLIIILTPPMCVHVGYSPKVLRFPYSYLRSWCLIYMYVWWSLYKWQVKVTTTRVDSSRAGYFKHGVQLEAICSIVQLRKFNSCHHDLVNSYGTSVSQMITDIFNLSSTLSGPFLIHDFVGFVTRVTRRVPLFTLTKNMSSPQFFVGFASLNFQFYVYVL